LSTRTTGGRRGRSSLVDRRSLLRTLVLQHQVVGQPGQMPCPRDLPDAAQLQRSAVLLHAPLRAVDIDRLEAQADLGLLFGRCRLRERRNGQFFGLAIAAGPVEPPHRFSNQ
jgi:hypothetical protein